MRNGVMKGTNENNAQRFRLKKYILYILWNIKCRSNPCNRVALQDRKEQVRHETPPPPFAIQLDIKRQPFVCGCYPLPDLSPHLLKLSATKAGRHNGFLSATGFLSAFCSPLFATSTPLPIPIKQFGVARAVCLPLPLCFVVCYDWSWVSALSQMPLSPWSPGTLTEKVRV